MTSRISDTGARLSARPVDRAAVWRLPRVDHERGPPGQQPPGRRDRLAGGRRPVVGDQRRAVGQRLRLRDDEHRSLARDAAGSRRSSRARSGPLRPVPRLPQTTTSASRSAAAARIGSHGWRAPRATAGSAASPIAPASCAPSAAAASASRDELALEPGRRSARRARGTSGRRRPGTPVTRPIDRLVDRQHRRARAPGNSAAAARTAASAAAEPSNAIRRPAVMAESVVVTGHESPAARRGLSRPWHRQPRRVVGRDPRPCAAADRRHQRFSTTFSRPAVGFTASSKAACASATGKTSVT